MTKLMTHFGTWMLDLRHIVELTQASAPPPGDTPAGSVVGLLIGVNDPSDDGSGALKTPVTIVPRRCR